MEKQDTDWRRQGTPGVGDGTHGPQLCEASGCGCIGESNYRGLWLCGWHCACEDARAWPALSDLLKDHRVREMRRRIAKCRRMPMTEALPEIREHLEPDRDGCKDIADATAFLVTYAKANFRRIPAKAYEKKPGQGVYVIAYQVERAFHRVLAEIARDRAHLTETSTEGKPMPDWVRRLLQPAVAENEARPVEAVDPEGTGFKTLGMAIDEIKEAA